MTHAQTQSGTSPVYDLFVIGGGINGVGIARDAAGRGLSVFLSERGDLAQGTSSASSKMIHGGLRYLEFYEFRLVREALHEREVLLHAAPHIIWPMQFVMPHSPGLRPAWMVRLGLFLYDNLAKRAYLPKSYGIDLRHSRFGRGLKPFVKKGFVYSDCWVEDARLVSLSALDAEQRGAKIHTRLSFTHASKTDEGLWKIELDGKADGHRTIYARDIVNATGPGLMRVAQRIDGYPEPGKAMRLVKGSHLIVKRLYDGDHAYILQNADRRMVFVFPYENDYTLIGTTDQDVTEDDIDHPVISQKETDYLLDAVNMYFTHRLTAADIHQSYSGIRPLFDDDENASNQTVSRDYRIEYGNNVLSVFGGKITTYRRLAEEAVNRIIAARHEHRPAWTERALLPGGDLDGTLEEFTQTLLETHPFLPASLATRYARQYGSRVHILLQYATSLGDLGEDFGDGLYAAEVDFLCDYEWAREADDILYRRTKLGLHVTAKTRAKLEAYLMARALLFAS